jgi:alpha-1,2-mannosyltransferase
MLGFPYSGSTYSRLLLAFLLTTWAFSLFFILPLLEDAGHVIEAFFDPGLTVHIAGPWCDFAMFWSVGQMQAAGHLHDVYKLQSMIGWEALNPANQHLQLPWFYPPPSLLLTSLIEYLPFFPAFFLWTVGIMLLSVTVLRLANLPRPVILVSIISPATLMATDFGQLAFLTGALMATGLLLAETNPRTAGGLLGALVYKPQAAILAPIIFVARRKWSGVGVGLLVSLGLCVLTTYAFGQSIWREFVVQGLPIARQLVIAPFPKQPPPIPSSDQFFGISVFWMFRSFGCNLVVSAALQALTAVAAALLCWRVWTIKQTNPVARAALTACLGLLTTPYCFVYDLSATSILFAALVWQERQLRTSDVLLFVWPMLGLAISLNAYLELAPIILAISAKRAWNSLQANSSVKA